MALAKARLRKVFFYLQVKSAHSMASASSWASTQKGREAKMKVVSRANRKWFVLRLFGLLAIFTILAGMLFFSPKRFTTVRASNPDPGDWSTYMKDNARTGFNSDETIINRSTAASLKYKWKYKAGGSINSQPAVVN